MSQPEEDTTREISRRKVMATTGLAGAGLLAGCSSGGGSEGSSDTEAPADEESDVLSGEINITGSSTVFPLATAVAEQFQRDHPEVDISIQSTGSGGGFENFFSIGESDINNASRPIKASEVSACQQNGVSPHEVIVATDALTVVVNNENDFATEMTVEELRQIWSSDASAGQTWADVNSSWPDEEIERYGAAETSGTFDYLTEVINGEEGDHTQDYEPTEQDRQIVQGVQGSEFAIGYFGFSYFFNNPDAVTAVAVDNGDGPVEPNLDTASSGEYAPLSRPLFTYPNEKRLSEDHIAEFVRFFIEQSANEEVVAGQVGYVPRSASQAETELAELNGVIDG